MANLDVAINSDFAGAMVRREKQFAVTSHIHEHNFVLTTSPVRSDIYANKHFDRIKRSHSIDLLYLYQSSCSRSRNNIAFHLRCKLQKNIVQSNSTIIG